MNRYPQIGERDLEFIKSVLHGQDLSFLREPSLEERTSYYHETQKKMLFLGCVTSVILAAAIPFKNIPFFNFAVILFVSRLADIISTIFCLQMPGMFESNPYCEANSLSPAYTLKHLLRILVDLGVAFLLSLWLPVPIRILLLTYAISSFAAAASNFYQVFSFTNTGTLFFTIANGVIGAAVFFLFKIF